MDVGFEDCPPHGSLEGLLKLAGSLLSPHASKAGKALALNGSSWGRGLFSFLRVEVVDDVPKASCTFAVKGSKLFSTKGSAPSISKGSP